MSARLPLAAGVAVALWLAAGTPAPAQPGGEPGKAPKKLKRAEILHILTEEVDVSMLQNAKLGEVLNLLKEKIANQKGATLPIFVDTESFKVENPDAPPIEVGEVLDVALGQAATANATFLIRQGKLEITTDRRADPPYLLGERVFAVFKNRPFGDALEELSEQTGVSIVIDPRVNDKINTPVTATFVNNSSLEVAVLILTNMVGVEPVLLRDVVYITTAENAQKLRPQQQLLKATNSKSLKKEKIFQGPGVPGLPGGL
jgi:hypothetical protein